jgi:uncharacterized protein (TIRG00374 family)
MTDSARRKPALGIIAGWVLAAACLVWVFHDIKPAELLRQLSGLRWPLAALALLVESASYFVMGTRWRILLKPGLPISPLKTTQAIYAGMFLSQVFPLRIGELARGFLVSRWSGIGFLSVLPSMALERFFEAFWMTLGLGLLALLVPLPRNFITAGKILGAAIAILAVLIPALILRRPAPAACRPEPDRTRGRVRRTLLAVLAELRTELRDIGLGRRFFAAFGMSLIAIGMWALTFWMIMRAYGIREALPVGFAVWLITHVGIALPNSPGNVGSYQFFCVLALLLFGVDKTAATGFSVIAFILVSIPQVAIGAVCLARSGMTAASLRAGVTGFRGWPAAGSEQGPGGPPPGGLN